MLGAALGADLRRRRADRGRAAKLPRIAASALVLRAPISPSDLRLGSLPLVHWRTAPRTSAADVWEHAEKGGGGQTAVCAWSL